MSAEDLSNTETEKEKIEGLDKDEDAFLGDYPIDTVLIRNESRTVHEVLRRIDKGSFIMDPDFQRDFIWQEDKQSKLIESVLMRIPLPVFYLAEDNEGRMVVVDGLQRLSTFHRFVNNELTLKLPEQSTLHKKKFEDLSPKLQNRVEDCNLILYIVDVKVPERARLDIFERVNGGVPLTRQQMRNCLFMGDATLFLKKEAQTKLFKRVTGGSLRTSTMRDREFINRFCAFKTLPLSAYRGDMDEFLAQSLRKMNQSTLEDLNALSSQFRNSMRNNREVFKEHAFRKHTAGQDGRKVINASLWDVMSVNLSEYPSELVKDRAERLRFAFYELMEDWEFEEAISRGTNDARRVRYRFECVQEAFGEVLDD